MDQLPQTLLAKALYDNQPDCSDELAFCKGDILTVVQQEVADSEGWWQCVLHGRSGLAPANRLQLLPDTQTPFPKGPKDACSDVTCQVPTGPVYEHMRSWVEGPRPACTQVYDLPASARIMCEKTLLSLPQQALLTVPRPARASLPLPSQTRVLKEPAKQWLYDIPPNPQKSALGSCHISGPTITPASMTILRRGGCSTLPAPQKSEWVYDTPGPPHPARVSKPSPTSFAGELRPHTVPPNTSSFLSPLDTGARSLTPHIPHSLPTEKKISPARAPLSGCPASRGTPFPAERGTCYHIPPSFLHPHSEAQNTKPNIYDIPQGHRGALGPENELKKAPAGPEMPLELNSSWIPKQAAGPSTELDGVSVSSSDSRASVFSSCSSMSTESSSSSGPEELAWELPVDLSEARETVTVLQQRVTGSVSNLLLFVSRKWRFRDHLEANLTAIRSAADRVQDTLREFLDFAQGLRRAVACHLPDSHLQARIRDQLETIANAYQSLLEAKNTLESFNWSLDLLATDQPLQNPDDLERFVTVARLLPEDIKRFTSMVIANGKLLFKQNCTQEENSTPRTECVQQNRTPQKHTPGLPEGKDTPQRCSPLEELQAAMFSSELVTGKCLPNAHCQQKLSDQEENEKPILKQGLNRNKDSERQNSETRAHLSEHCRLYFGALLKAVGVLRSSLQSCQPPEVFVTQSKLVIMVGQRLVDTLCQETQERDARNEILCCSSHLCGLLRNLALATKHVVLQHPSQAALTCLQADAEQLERHVLHFRGMLE